MTHPVFWQIYNYEAKLVKQLISAGFTVWRWRNSDRITVEGTEKKMTYFYLKNDISKSCFVKIPFPDPKCNCLAERLN
jgi:hypothetical protein